MTRIALFLVWLWCYLGACHFALATAFRKLMARRGRLKRSLDLRTLIVVAVARSKALIVWAVKGLGGVIVWTVRGVWNLIVGAVARSRASIAQAVVWLWRLIVTTARNGKRFAVRVATRALSFIKASVRQCAELARALTRKLYRLAESVGIRLARGHRQILYQATFRLFERLKRSRHKGIVLRHYAALMRRRVLPANDLSGLIALSLEAKEKVLCRQFVDALFRHHPTDYEVHKGAAIRCFHLGEYDEAFDIWTRSEDCRADHVTAQGLDKLSLRFLGPSWFIVIGHIAHLDTYFKHQILSRSPVTQYAALIPSQIQIHNPYLLNLWRASYFTEGVPTRDPALTFEQIIALTDEFWHIRFAPKQTWMFSKAGARVQQAWAESGRPPLLRMPDADVERCWDAMAAMGVPRNSWFACLHVREPGFHGAWNKKHPATRDADIDTYRLVIDAVVQRGGHVIRMGDSTMKPLGDRAGAIDYAHGDFKSDMMDIFLCAHCRFFIGTNSGLSMVPPVFGKPCALTNWSPIAIQNWFPGDLFIPKQIQRRKTGEYLSFEEQFGTPAGWQQFSNYFDDNELRIIDNTPEELRDLVVEMMDRLDGAATYTDEDNRRQAAFAALSIKYAGYLGSGIGRDFLRRYESALYAKRDGRSPCGDIRQSGLEHMT